MRRDELEAFKSRINEEMSVAEGWFGHSTGGIKKTAEANNAETLKQTKQRQADEDKARKAEEQNQLAQLKRERDLGNAEANYNYHKNLNDFYNGLKNRVSNAVNNVSKKVGTTAQSAVQDTKKDMYNAVNQPQTQAHVQDNIERPVEKKSIGQRVRDGLKNIKTNYNNLRTADREESKLQQEKEDLTNKVKARADKFKDISPAYRKQVASYKTSAEKAEDKNLKDVSDKIEQNQELAKNHPVLNAAKGQNKVEDIANKLKDNFKANKGNSKVNNKDFEQLKLDFKAAEKADKEQKKQAEEAAKKAREVKVDDEGQTKLDLGGLEGKTKTIDTEEVTKAKNKPADDLKAEEIKPEERQVDVPNNTEPTEETTEQQKTAEEADKKVREVEVDDEGKTKTIEPEKKPLRDKFKDGLKNVADKIKQSQNSTPIGLSELQNKDKQYTEETKPEENNNGFGADGIHKETGTKFDKDGYDVNGYSKYGFNKSNFNKDGINKFTNTKFDKEGYDSNGFDKDGLDRDGFDVNGFNKRGLDKNGLDKDGFDVNGWNKDGINKETGTKFDKDGYNSKGFNANGFNKDGFDEDERDNYGFDKNGFDSNGINRETGTEFNKYGYNKDGFDKDGYNSKGFNANGYNKDGYSKDGYNKDGFDANGWNKDGINRETGTKFDKDGFGKYGWNEDNINRETGTKFDKDGYDRYGFDKDGFNEDGWNLYGINRETGTKFDKDGIDVDGNKKTLKDKVADAAYGAIKGANKNMQYAKNVINKKIPYVAQQGRDEGDAAFAANNPNIPMGDGQQNQQTAQQPQQQVQQPQQTTNPYLAQAQAAMASMPMFNPYVMNPYMMPYMNMANPTMMGGMNMGGVNPQQVNAQTVGQGLQQNQPQVPTAQPAPQQPTTNGNGIDLGQAFQAGVNNTYNKNTAQNTGNGYAPDANMTAAIRAKLENGDSPDSFSPEERQAYDYYNQNGLIKDGRLAADDELTQHFNTRSINNDIANNAVNKGKKVRANSKKAQQNLNAQQNQPTGKNSQEPDNTSNAQQTSTTNNVEQTPDSNVEQPPAAGNVPTGEQLGGNESNGGQPNNKQPEQSAEENKDIAADVNKTLNNQTEKTEEDNQQTQVNAQDVANNLEQSTENNAQYDDNDIEKVRGIVRDGILDPSELPGKYKDIYDNVVSKENPEDLPKYTDKDVNLVKELVNNGIKPSNLTGKYKEVYDNAISKETSDEEPQVNPQKVKKNNQGESNVVVDNNQETTTNNQVNNQQTITNKEEQIPPVKGNNTTTETENNDTVINPSEEQSKKADAYVPKAVTIRNFREHIKDENNLNKLIEKVKKGNKLSDSNSKIAAKVLKLTNGKTDKNSVNKALRILENGNDYNYKIKRQDRDTITFNQGANEFSISGTENVNTFYDIANKIQKAVQDKKIEIDDFGDLSDSKVKSDGEKISKLIKDLSTTIPGKLPANKDVQANTIAKMIAMGTLHIKEDGLDENGNPRFKMVEDKRPWETQQKIEAQYWASLKGKEEEKTTFKVEELPSGKAQGAGTPASGKNKTGYGNGRAYKVSLVANDLGMQRATFTRDDVDALLDLINQGYVPDLSENPNDLEDPKGRYSKSEKDLFEALIKVGAIKRKYDISTDKESYSVNNLYDFRNLLGRRYYNPNDNDTLSFTANSGVYTPDALELLSMHELKPYTAKANSLLKQFKPEEIYTREALSTIRDTGTKPFTEGADNYLQHADYKDGYEMNTIPVNDVVTDNKKVSALVDSKSNRLNAPLDSINNVINIVKSGKGFKDAKELAQLAEKEGIIKNEQDEKDLGAAFIALKNSGILKVTADDKNEKTGFKLADNRIGNLVEDGEGNYSFEKGYKTFRGFHNLDKDEKESNVSVNEKTGYTEVKALPKGVLLRDFNKIMEKISKGREIAEDDRLQEVIKTLEENGIDVNKYQDGYRDFNTGKIVLEPKQDNKEIKTENFVLPGGFSEKDFKDAMYKLKRGEKLSKSESNIISTFGNAIGIDNDSIKDVNIDNMHKNADGTYSGLDFKKLTPKEEVKQETTTEDENVENNSNEEIKQEAAEGKPVIKEPQFNSERNVIEGGVLKKENGSEFTVTELRKGLKDENSEAGKVIKAFLPKDKKLSDFVDIKYNKKQGEYTLYTKTAHKENGVEAPDKEEVENKSLGESIMTLRLKHRIMNLI